MRFHTRHIKGLLAAGIVSLVSTGCLLGASDSQGPSLLRTGPEPAGERCEYGGVRVESGRDLDGNGMLDNDEVERASFACNARVDGFDSRTRIDQGAPDDVCPDGGVTVLVGLDADDDGRLDDAEVEQRTYLCHGEGGQDGFTSLTGISEIDPGPDSPCYFGGTRVSAGLDLDRDQVLDPEEITHARDVCAVHTNDRMTLATQRPEPRGSNCEHGGVAFESGFDEDGDGLLSPTEIDHVGYVCSEVVVIDGKNSLIDTKPATGGQCRGGGYVLSTGLDLDADGVLGAAEVSSTSLVCNGEDGLHALVETTPYSASGPACSGEPGVLVEAGRDLNINGVLDSGEVEHSEIVCDGKDGFLGRDGADSLIRTSDHRGICPDEGFRFEAGLDLDGDGNLDPAEVTSVEYVCDGFNGFDSLVEMGPHDGVCFLDGFSLEVGLDLDSDGYLDANEVTQTAYLCDGEDGYDSLVEITPDPIDCPTTGLRFDTGLDLDYDAYLDSNEIQHTTIVCD